MGKIIEGSVDLERLYLTELFDLSDVEVTGDFRCSFNNLTNLEGSPHTVVGYFSCINNKLTSLEGAPQTVGKNFYCMYNDLTSLKGIPKTVGNDFYIDESLEDKFPEEYIRSLCNIEGDVEYV